MYKFHHLDYSMVVLSRDLAGPDEVFVILLFFYIVVGNISLKHLFLAFFMCLQEPLFFLFHCLYT